MSSLPTQVSILSVAEKFELLDALWQDLEAQTQSLGEEQRAELDRRAARYEQNPSDVLPWDDVKRHMVKR